MKTPLAEEMPEFVRLLTQHQRDLFLYIRSLLADPHEADDVLQEANLAIWSNRSDFRLDSNFRAWAFQIARHRVLQHAARRDKMAMRFSDALVGELVVHAEKKEGELDSLSGWLQHCVEKLPESDRELIRKRYSPGATGERVASELGRPLQWVYKAVFRIRKQLFDCVNRQLARQKGGTR